MNILIADLCVESHSFNTHAQLPSGTRRFNCVLSLPVRSDFVCASSKGSGETARKRRLARAFAARKCD